MKRAVILVGHGAPPRDAPHAMVATLKRLEGERARSGGPMTEEERALDARLRAWPRSPGSDPYGAGLEALAAALRRALPEAEVVTAYNEFAAPSLPEAVHALTARGLRDIVVVPSMLTRGGVHSEVEIPEALAALEVPEGTRVTYAWPFDEADVAALLAARVRAATG